MEDFSIAAVNPYVRLVTNYRPVVSYRESLRIIFDHELIYLAEGSVEITYDGVPYDLHKGNVLFIRPFVKNFMEIRLENAPRLHCIHFDWFPPKEEFTTHYRILEEGERVSAADYPERDCSEPADLSIPTVISGAGHERLSELFAGCYYSFMKHDPMHILQLKGNLLSILADLTGRSSDEGGLYLHPKMIDVINDLESNYASPLQVETLAARYGFSPKYFGTLFRKSTGKSLNAYLLGLRISAAQEMLSRSRLPVETIAEKVGFANQFYFSRCFRQETGMTPTDYRRSSRG